MMKTGKSKSLSESVEELAETLKGTVSRVIDIDKRLTKAVSRLDLIEPGEVERFLKRSHVDIARISERLQIEILKVTVLTEVSRATRKVEPGLSYRIQQALIRSLDNDEAWWRERDGWTIGQWVDDLMKPKGVAA